MKRKICLFLLFVLTLPILLFSCTKKGINDGAFSLADKSIHAVCDIYINEYAYPVGKGVVLDGEARILTVAHLLEDINDLSNICLVFPDGFTYRSQVICIDTHNDLALLTAPLREGLQIALKVDLKPPAYILRPDNETQILSVPSLSLRKALSDTKPEQLICLDTYVRKGASGAPVVNSEGKIIGVVTARSTDGKYTYAVGTKVLMDFLKS